MKRCFFASLVLLATVANAQEVTPPPMLLAPNAGPPSGVTDTPQLPRTDLVEPVYREPRAPEPADFPPTLAPEANPLVHLGSLYFDAPHGCVDDFGKFDNNPKASLKVMSVRNTNGRTYIEVVANRDCLVFIGENSSMKTDEMKLEVYAGKPQVFTMTAGEKGYVEMNGTFEYFAYENPFKDEEGTRHTVDGHNLFQPVPRQNLPSAIMPAPRLNEKRGPAWLDGTIEPLDEEPKREQRKKPIQYDGPIAEESRPQRS